MNKKIKNIARIQFGTSVKKSKNGDIACLQVSDIGENGSVNPGALKHTRRDQIEESDYLKPGDILLPAKGNRLTAGIVTEELMPSIASSSLFVIRIQNETISPEYLQWYLNLPRTQWELKKYATGTNISSLSIRDFRKFEILIPALETQQKIMGMQTLQAKEKYLINRINELRKKLINALSKKVITNEINS